VDPPVASRPAARRNDEAAIAVAAAASAAAAAAGKLCVLAFVDRWVHGSTESMWRHVLAGP